MQHCVEEIETVSSGNSSQQLYTPQVKNELIPKIGQHFHNLGDVRDFYNNYGREGGFGTRLNSSKKSPNGEIIRKEFVCYKEGLRRIVPNKTQQIVRKRGLTRVACGARVVVVKDRTDAGGFVIRQFVEGHNHPLTTPRKVHLLHSHRVVTLAKRNLTEQLSKANVPTWQQMSILEMEAGGLENVGCTTRDLYNAERDRRRALKGHDANLLFECFKDEKKKNPGFTFTFEQEEGVNEKPQTVTGRVMEYQMSELYTHTIFYKFQEQLLESGKYVVTRTFKDDNNCMYNVHRVKDGDSNDRKLSFDKSSNFVKCSCQMFESDGIPCRHMLAYFTKKQVMELPNQYILRRWTKSAKCGRVMDDLGGRVSEICDTSVLLRRSSLFQIASNVIDEAALSEDDTKELKELLLSTQRRFAAMNHGSMDVEGSINMPISFESQQLSLKEPFSVRTKGCGKRLKGGNEKAIKKARKCNGCGIVGVSHDKRNCPKLVGVYDEEDVDINDD